MCDDDRGIDTRREAPSLMQIFEYKDGRKGRVDDGAADEAYYRCKVCNLRTRMAARDRILRHGLGCKLWRLAWRGSAHNDAPVKIMDRIDIDTWATIRAEGWSSLLFGNGASIAIHKEFIPNTHGIADAKGLLATTAPIFAKPGITDFEACSAGVLVCRARQRGIGATRPPSRSL